MAGLCTCQAKHRPWIGVPPLVPAATDAPRCARDARSSRGARPRSGPSRRPAYSSKSFARARPPTTRGSNPVSDTSCRAAATRGGEGVERAHQPHAGQVRTVAGDRRLTMSAAGWAGPCRGLRRAGSVVWTFDPVTQVLHGLAAPAELLEVAA